MQNRQGFLRLFFKITGHTPASFSDIYREV